MSGEAGVHKASPSKMEGFGGQMRSVDMGDEEPDLSGHIGGGGGAGSGAESDTLDEPVWDTVRRDLQAVGRKFAFVVLPGRSKESLLRDWDLWGPLFICVLLSLLLEGGGGGGGGEGRGPEFTQVFAITFFGACVVTLNCQLLGGSISFFQALCVLGYCLLPPAVAAVLSSVLLNFTQTTTLFALRLIMAGVGFAWATYASVGFLAAVQPPRRKALGVYPIGLFYFIVSWLIVSRSHYDH